MENAVGFDKKKLEEFQLFTNTGHFARDMLSKGTNDGKKEREILFFNIKKLGSKRRNQMVCLTMDGWDCKLGRNILKMRNKSLHLWLSAQAMRYLCLTCTSQKQQLSLNEKLAFQANEIHEKDEKLKRYRRIGMKAVKEKEQLQKIVDSWKDSSKNLWRLINSGMSSNDKLGLGFEIQSNDEVLSVPPPLSGDYTPKPQEEIDDSLYVYGKKGPQKPEISVSDDNSSEHSTCQSNDSEGSCGNTSEHSFETESESLDEPNEMSKSRLEVTNEKDVSVPKSTEVAPSCVSHIKTPRQPLKDNETHKVNRKSWNDMMKRELGEGKLRTNISSGRPKVNSGRPKVNSGRPKVNTVSPKVNTVRPRQPAPHTTSNSMSPKRPQMDQINQRRDFSTSYSSVRRPFAKSTAQMAHTNAVMGSWGSAVKTSASYNWRNPRPNFNYNSGPTFIRTVNANGPQGRPKPAKAWVPKRN
ncbi:hypothetical protein Tco_1243120 [Tanacetum coccineum]